MLLIVILGLAFSKRATSSSHSLCCWGCWDAGGAQSMLIVVGVDAAAVGLLALLVALLLLVLPVLAVLLELLLVQAAAVRTMPATLATAIIGR
jgi:hypothetical protein